MEGDDDEQRMIEPSGFQSIRKSITQSDEEGEGEDEEDSDEVCPALE